ncbi:MAG: flavin reductase family protein [Sandaracinaceae bacterium]|nr:flavin reductase family protein [Sandaracinaceae bacterium]
MELNPDELGAAERYKLLTGVVTPRPIAFVSTRSPDGRDNLAPFSFFNAVCSTPMSLVFSVGTPADGRDKDTLVNARPPAEGGLGCFVVNVAVEAYARQMAACAEELPYGESELALAGFTAAPSRRVAAPRVRQSPVSFECETTHVVALGEGPGSGRLVIGRVVHVWIRDDLVDERLRVDQAKLATIGRIGGERYCRTREVFSLPRGVASLALDPPFPEDVGAALARGA